MLADGGEYGISYFLIAGVSILAVEDIVALEPTSNFDIWNVTLLAKLV